jgi:hypothetical protein
VRNAAARETPFEVSLEPQVLGQILGEIVLREPVRMPILVVSDPKTVWMNFLSHKFSVRWQVVDGQLFSSLTEDH